MTTQELIQIAERVEEWYDGRGELINEPEETATAFAEFIGRLFSHISGQDALIEGMAEEIDALRHPATDPSEAAWVSPSHQSESAR